MEHVGLLLEQSSVAEQCCRYYSQLVTLASFVVQHNDIIGLNDTFVAELVAVSRTCGFEDALQQLSVYPHTGNITLDDNTLDSLGDYCNPYNNFTAAALEVNQCFNFCAFAIPRVRLSMVELI